MFLFLIFTDKYVLSFATLRQFVLSTRKFKKKRNNVVRTNQEHSNNQMPSYFNEFLYKTLKYKKIAKLEEQTVTRESGINLNKKNSITDGRIFHYTDERVITAGQTLRLIK